MLISEIYQSRQGEGILTGTPSVFVRTSGCNLRCGFCDTPFASWQPEGEPFTVEEIVSRINDVKADARHVVITGGEPMLPREINQLCSEIKCAGFHITIETAGTIFQSLDCDLMSISPKFSNSDPQESRAGEWVKRHRATRNRPDVVLHLMETYGYQLKFVIDIPSDLDEILEYLKLVNPNDKSRVLLMPQGVTLDELESRRQWLEPVCQKYGFSFCPRMHIQWYGNKRGT
ncbi:MAG: 7-carboxy-7-deazaguanine synthase QueE [Mariniblastus sp.]|nr:7-carboxy-7-deazaguanine synthase QueE [Mariniblastus sp.]